MDGERGIAETSIIVEYLQIAHPGPVRLLPADPIAALDVRFLDRFFDLHVSSAVQIAVDSVLGRLPVKRETGLDLAREKLERAYAWLEDQLAGRTWAAGGVHAGGLRGRTRAVLRGLDAPDCRDVSGAARLSRAVACPPVFFPSGGRGAAVPATLPPGRAGSGLKGAPEFQVREQRGALHRKAL